MKLAIGAIVIAHYEGQPVEIKITRIDRDYVRGRRIRKIWKDEPEITVHIDDITGADYHQ
jgi:hypothetical protein